ncbi:MAG: M16 family metallopeptidase [Cyclobacteriaceae bacterium]
MALDRSVAPPAQAIRQVHFLEAETTRLSNGLPLHMIRSGKQPVVGVEVIFRNGGVRHEEKNGAAYFTVKMLAEGTAHRDVHNISDTIDSLGAFLQLSPGLDYSLADLYMLSRHVDPLLGILREMLTEAIFPEDELENFKNIQRQQLRVNEKKSNILASRHFKATLFGSQHPYGKSLGFSDIDALEREDLLNFFRTRLLHQMEIVVSGDVNTEVLQALEKHFGDLPFEQFSPSDKLPSAKGYTEKKVLVKKPKNLQSSIRLGCQSIDKHHPDFHQLRVLNTVFGGYFGSRLMRNIREEKGLTYGINSGVITLAEAGYFIVGTEVKKELTQLAIDEIYREMQRLQDEPLPESELNTVKNYMAGRLLSSVDTPFALAEKFKNIHLYGLTYDFYKNYLNTINSVDVETLQLMAQRYLIPENMLEVVIGGYE